MISIIGKSTTIIIIITTTCPAEYCSRSLIAVYNHMNLDGVWSEMMTNDQKIDTCHTLSNPSYCIKNYKFYVASVLTKQLAEVITVLIEYN